MYKHNVEYTDTFGGEANYTWVRRGKIIHDGTVRSLKRKAKALMGLSNIRGTWEDFGDMLRFKPYRSCTVMFITYSEEE